MGRHSTRLGALATAICVIALSGCSIEEFAGTIYAWDLLIKMFQALSGGMLPY